MANNQGSFYNNRFQEEDPRKNCPRTTKWRIKKRKAQASDGSQTEICKTARDSECPQDDECIDTSRLEIPTFGVDPTCDSGRTDFDEATDFAGNGHWISAVEDEAEAEAGDGGVFNSADAAVSNDDIGYDGHEETRGGLPLYDGSPLTLQESALLILTLAFRHDLSGECLADILTLIELHCPSPNHCHKTLYRFKKHFTECKSPLKYHHFCENCSMYAGVKPGNMCSNEVCGKSFAGGMNLSYFIEIPLHHQLANFYQRKNFHKNILHRFNRCKHISENIEDIYDGSLYKHHSQDGGFLANVNNISFMWYTDGVQVFKSSKASIWPIYFAINELPVNQRMHPDNMIFAGLYIGQEKPCMTSYLKPFCDALTSMVTEGTTVLCNHCNDTFNVKAMLLCGTCDMPAKAVVMNMTQFNGEYGCPLCKQSGEVVATGKGHTRVYPFNSDNIDGPPRTKEETTQFAEEALEQGGTVEGIKGPAWFSSLEWHDIIRGTAVDYMHGVLLGVVRLLLKLWFDTKYSSECFSISKFVSEIDQRLLSIKPPKFVTRLPRSIQAHKKFWKANECRAWLFFYSVPVLYGILPTDHYEHYLLLVEALYILNKESISHEDLVHCRRVLIHYCSLFEALYGENRIGINVHQLLHLVDVVFRLGPLWVYSCFSFETLNGKLVKMIHGATKPLIQVANAISFMLKIPELGEKLTADSKAMALYAHLRGRGGKISLGEFVSDGKYTVGKLSVATKDMFASATNLLSITPKQVYTFFRAHINGNLVSSKGYTALKSRISHIVELQSGEIAEVQNFLKVVSCHCGGRLCTCDGNPSFSYVAVIKKYVFVDLTSAGLCNDNLTNIRLPQCKILTEKGESLSAIEMHHIKDVCVVVESKYVPSLPGLSFVSVAPNHLEGD